MTLYDIAEQAYRQAFPNPSDETGITREEFVSSAQTIYAQAIWVLAKQERATEGLFNVPSHLLSEVSLEVKAGEIDLDGLNILRSLPNDTWLQNIGGLTCDCNYVGSNVNLTQLLCDDEFQGDTKTFVVIGKKIRFPNGVHTSPLSIIYANDGTQVDGKMVEVDNAVGALVRDKLNEWYSRKGVEDTTNNTSSKI